MSKVKSFVSKNISVQWSYDLRKTIQKQFSNRQLETVLQSSIIPMIKDTIAKGLSPVEGKRMFDKYKNPKTYPGKLKPSNKANLFLSGDMLSEYKVKSGKEPLIMSFGIHDDAGRDIKARAKANNSGTENIPARRFVPWGGENYIRRITLEVKKAFAYALNQAINKEKIK